MSTGRKRGGQEGHPGASRNLLPAEQCAEVIPHCHTTTCAALPAGVERGSFGPQLSALVEAGLVMGDGHPCAGGVSSCPQPLS